MRTCAPRIWLAFLPVVFLATWERTALAQGKIEVTVLPRGKPWSVGEHGGAECNPGCTITLEPGIYPVQIGEAKEKLLLQVPADITYDPGSPVLRKAGLYTFIGGFAAGGVLGGLGIWGFIKSCAEPAGCPANQVVMTRTAAEVLIGTAASLITISVAGGILFAVSGESVDLHELAPAPERERKRSFQVMLAPAPSGAGFALKTRF